MTTASFFPENKTQSARYEDKTWSARFWLFLRGMLAAALLVSSGWFFFDAARIEEMHINGGTAPARAEAERLLRQLQGHSILFADISDLQKRLAALPGIEAAAVRRNLPTSLMVELRGRQALAVWDGGGLVDSSGRRYNGVAAGWLPVFRGSVGRAASMANFYDDAGNILQPLGLVIAQLQVDGDGEWRVFLQSGTVLYLGREDRLARLRRYAKHAQQLHKKFTQLQAVDLRYKKGFSVIPMTIGEDSA